MIALSVLPDLEGFVLEKEFPESAFWEFCRYYRGFFEDQEER